jgi:Leucine-rich repeat (LRR) protein
MTTVRQAILAASKLNSGTIREHLANLGLIEYLIRHPLRGQVTHTKQLNAKVTAFANVVKGKVAAFANVVKGKIKAVAYIVEEVEKYVCIPDSNFEQALIDLGIDSNPVIDGKVLKSDVEGVTFLDVNSKNISDLTGIGAFTSLEILYCNSNQLTSLDVSNNTALTYLSCTVNQLTSLDVSNNTALTYLSCTVNQLTSLDVGSNTALTYLYCFSNQLTSLDVSNNTALTYLYCNSNQLTSLDVSNNTALTYLYCFSNQLTSLDVGSNTALTYLSCTVNQLTSLDISANTLLEQLFCARNQLTSLNVANGNNTNFIRLYANSNPNLTCIQVDDVAYSEANWTGSFFIFDPQTSFSENCN